MKGGVVQSVPENAAVTGTCGAALPALVDIEAVSRSFGISVRQVRRFVAEGEIPYVRVGHLIRFDPDELNDWIDSRRAGSVRAP
jgi:excisionase family DNA binding protein